MIEIVVNNKKQCFNLKNSDREKSLFNTWYAMSDMPSHREKKLRIITDKDEILEYKICDIQDCVFIDGEYIEDQEPKTLSSTDSDIEDMTVEEIYDKYVPSDTEFSKVLRSLYCKLFQAIPKKKLIKIFRYSYDIRMLGYNVDIQDIEIQNIVEEMLKDSDDVDVAIYVNKTIEYLQRKKLC